MQALDAWGFGEHCANEDRFEVSEESQLEYGSGDEWVSGSFCFAFLLRLFAFVVCVLPPRRIWIRVYWTMRIDRKPYMTESPVKLSRLAHSRRIDMWDTISEGQAEGRGIQCIYLGD